MRISAKTEYACIAMLELAAAYDGGEPAPIRQIADKNGIPSGFLVQIMLQLKAAGLVISTRGAAGGYQLASPPDEITLLDVMNVIDPQETAPAEGVGKRSAAARVLHGAWREVSDAQEQMLSAINFAELGRRARERGESMYYI